MSDLPRSVLEGESLRVIDAKTAEREAACRCGGRILFFAAEQDMAEVAHTEPECAWFAEVCASLEQERPPVVVEVVG